MGFKIESFDTLRTIANRVDDRSNEMISQAKIANNALDNLKVNIVCDGITETLGNLQIAISDNTKSVSKLLIDSGNFIVEQIGLYEEQNKTTSPKLSTTESNLEDII